MVDYTNKTNLKERLRASPTFVQALSFDGRAYVAKETEPYIQYWLTERYRILLSIFSSRRGATVGEAIDSYFNLTRMDRSEAENNRLINAIQKMCDAGVLIDKRDDVSRYDSSVVENYIRHRPLPREIADLIIENAPVKSDSRVIDLAGGTGDLALILAKVSKDVSLMEISKGFLKAAGNRARKSGFNLNLLHDSCNRLVFANDKYDVITVSQALHWLDDVLVCRGVCRLLLPGGSFFVIYSCTQLEEQHPLSKLGNNPFRSAVKALFTRITLLFEALDTPEVDRSDLAHERGDTSNSESISKIIPVGVSLFHQRRPFEMGYARSLFTPEHISDMGYTPSAFWKKLESQYANATSEQIIGSMYWAVIHFQLGGVRIDSELIESSKIKDIGFDYGELE